jgi:hypothetical protein
VVTALEAGAQFIVTGRVTDTGITVAPMIHHFGWDPTDWDKIASGIIAGHILECGAQSTGGNFTDWHRVPSFDDIGYPIVEVDADGSFVVTKHEGTGGLVSVETIKEQLVYEMGDPKAYLTPDVIVDFTSIQLESRPPSPSTSARTPRGGRWRPPASRTRSSSVSGCGTTTPARSASSRRPSWRCSCRVRQGSQPPVGVRPSPMSLPTAPV